MLYDHIPPPTSLAFTPLLNKINGREKQVRKRLIIQSITMPYGFCFLKKKRKKTTDVPIYSIFTISLLADSLKLIPSLLVLISASFVTRGHIIPFWLMIYTWKHNEGFWERLCLCDQRGRNC